MVEFILLAIFLSRNFITMNFYKKKLFPTEIGEEPQTADCKNIRRDLIYRNPTKYTIQIG